MSRRSLRRRFLVGAVASTLVTLVLFAAATGIAIVLDDDAETDILTRHETYQQEVREAVVNAMLIAAPLGVIVAVVMAMFLARRTVRPVEEAIRGARETTAQDLHRRLPVPANDDEIRELVVALNELFARLDDGFGALARFAADASHELRTPLAVMATDLEVALRYPRPAPEWEAIGRANLDELRRVSSLVEGLLMLARAGADAPTARRRVSLVDCIDTVLALLASEAEAAGVELRPPPEDPTLLVDANAVMLETAIRNLVENAIAATPRGGHVALTIDVLAAETRLLVDDTGPGLGADPEALFVPFRRGALGPTDSAAPDPHRAGVGLGLAIARRIAVAHGGRLIPGRSPTGGARLALALPRTP